MLDIIIKVVFNTTMALKDRRLVFKVYFSNKSEGEKIGKVDIPLIKGYLILKVLSGYGVLKTYYIEL